MLKTNDKLNFENVNLIKRIDIMDIHKIVGYSINLDLLHNSSFILYFDDKTNNLYEIKNRLDAPPEKPYDILEHFLNNPSFTIKKSKTRDIDFKVLLRENLLKEGKGLSILLIN